MITTFSLQVDDVLETASQLGSCFYKVVNVIHSTAHGYLVELALLGAPKGTVRPIVPLCMIEAGIAGGIYYHTPKIE